MPLSFPFTTYSPPETAGPSLVGVYELGWPCRSGYSVVYIGSTNNIQRRLREHVNSSKNWAVYRCLTTGCRRRANQIERVELQKFERRHGRMPKYNQRIG